MDQKTAQFRSVQNSPARVPERRDPQSRERLRLRVRSEFDETPALVLTPATLGVGLLEFHQQDRMVRAGREAARAVLDGPGGDWLYGRLGPQDVVPDDRPPIALPEPRGHPVPLS